MDTKILFDAYCKRLYNQEFSITTVWNYKAIVKTFLKFFAYKKDIEEITLEDFKGWLNMCNTENTKKTKITAIKNFYRIMEIETINFDCFDSLIRKRPIYV